MTLFEFQKKLPTVSDRRLVRMLERARLDGLEPAVDLILAEQKRRKADGRITAFLSVDGPTLKVSEAPARISPLNPEVTPEEELSSQIRPLEEVLGRQFAWQPKTILQKADSKSEPLPESSTSPKTAVDLSALEQEMNAPITLEFRELTKELANGLTNGLTNGLASGLAKTPEDEPEEMSPAPASLPEWQKTPKWQSMHREGTQRTEPLAPLSSSPAAKSKQNLTLLAILLLLLAGFLAIWRALVG